VSGTKLARPCAQARGVAFDQDELQPLAEDSLDGALVARIGAQHVGDEAVNTVAAALLLVAQQDRLHPAPVPFEVLLQLEQRGESAAPVGQLLADADEQRLGIAALRRRLLQLVFVRRAALVQRPAVVLRLAQLRRHFVALPLDLSRSRQQLLALAPRLLQAPGQLLPAPLQVDEVRAVVRQPREHRHGLVPLGLDGVLRGVDPSGRVVERRLRLRAARLVLDRRVGELLLLGVEPVLLAREQLEALPEQPDLVLMLHLPRRDRFALALRELHLLLG
jgi:hypothetical protein